MTAAVRAGVCYFLQVFCAGAILGVPRILIVAPRLGSLVAVLIELPLMLFFAWVVCGRLVRRVPVPRGAARAVMGTVAFIMLTLMELVLDRGLNGTGLKTHFARYGEPAEVAGLAGQVAFGLLPLLR